MAYERPERLLCQDLLPQLSPLTLRREWQREQGRCRRHYDRA